MWKCSPLPCYTFLDADISPEDPQVGQGELQDTPGAGGIFFLLLYFFLDFGICFSNYDSWACYEALF